MEIHHQKMRKAHLLPNLSGHEPAISDTYLSFLAGGTKGTLLERKGKLKKRMIHSENAHLKSNLPSSGKRWRHVHGTRWAFLAKRPGMITGSWRPDSSLAQQGDIPDATRQLQETWVILEMNQKPPVDTATLTALRSKMRGECWYPQLCTGHIWGVLETRGELIHTVNRVVERLELPSPFHSQQGWSSWMVNSDWPC